MDNLKLRGLQNQTAWPNASNPVYHDKSKQLY